MEIRVVLKIELDEETRQFLREALKDLLEKVTKEEVKEKKDEKIELPEIKQKKEERRVTIFHPDEVLMKVKEIFSREQISEQSRKIYTGYCKNFIKVMMQKGIENIKIDDIEEFAQKFKPEVRGAARNIAFLTIALTDKNISRRIHDLLDKVTLSKNRYAVIGLYYFTKRLGTDVLIRQYPKYSHLINEVFKLIKYEEELKEKEVKETQEFLKDLAKKERLVMNGILK